MTDTEQRFLALLRDYMAPAGREAPLFKFLDSLRFEDVRDCASIYFKHDQDGEYVHQRTKSSAVFLKLATTLLDKGDVYFALRLEIMVRGTGLPWQAHYTALPPNDRQTLQKWIARKKYSLTPAQRRFIDLFDRYMKKQISQNQVEAFTSVRKTFEERRDCLFAYVEISQGYEARNGKESLLIFLGLSRATIWRCPADFAHLYQARVAEKDSPWRERYQSMDAGSRSLIEKDIADKLTIRSDVDVKLKDKTYKATETGHYQFAPVAHEKTYPEDREKAAPVSDVQRQFLSLYRQFVDRGDRKSMDAFQEFLRTRSANDLQACVASYINDSTYRGTDANPRSLVMFFGVLSRALTKSDAYYATKVNSLVHTPGTTWNARFMALDKTQYRDPLEKQIKDEIRKKARLIDDVKAAFYASRHSDPDAQTLQTFEPASAGAQEERLSKALSDCDIAIAVKDPQRFETAFDALGAILDDEKDPLALLVLIRRCRERPGLDGRFRRLFYLYGVGLLFIRVLVQRPTVYKAGLDREEMDWLLGESRDRYYSDFVLQLGYAMRKRSGPATVAALCKAEGSLHIYADKYRLNLTPTLEAAALLGTVETLWQKKGQELAALRIPIMSQRDGKKELRIGQTIGNFYILWWDFKRRIVYLHVNGFDKVVFEIDQDRLANIYDHDALYGEIARGTQAILELMPVFWQAIMLIPDLVSGGLTGLAKSIAFNYAFDKSTEALGLDPTQVQVLLFGAGLLAHGLMPKDPAAPKVTAEVVAVEHDLGPRARGTAADMRGIVRRDGIIEIRGADDPDIAALVADAPGSPAGSPGATTAHGTQGPQTLGDIPGQHAPDVAGVTADAPAGAADFPPARQSPIDAQTRGTGTAEGHGGAGGQHEADLLDLANERATASDSHATGGRGSDARASDPHDRATGTAHDDPNASPRGDADKGLSDHPDVMRVGEGISGRSKARFKPTPVKNRPPLPPHIRDRIKRGNWSQDGEVHINQDGYNFRKSKGTSTDFRKYQEGFRQEIAKPIAEGVSDKTVLKLGPEDTGYRSSSSGSTNRLKLEKGRIGIDKPLERIPDATMEVVENLPKGGKTVTEVHFFEATLETDFPAAVARAGHKQRQIEGTIWISQARKGYTPDTKLYYHIISKGPPTPTTVAFLDDLMGQFPNLEFNWFVVKP